MKPKAEKLSGRPDSAAAPKVPPATTITKPHSSINPEPMYPSTARNITQPLVRRKRSMAMSDTWPLWSDGSALGAPYGLSVEVFIEGDYTDFESSKYQRKK